MKTGKLQPYPEIILEIKLWSVPLDVGFKVGCGLKTVIPVLLVLGRKEEEEGKERKGERGKGRRGEEKDGKGREGKGRKRKEQVVAAAAKSMSLTQCILDQYVWGITWGFPVGRANASLPFKHLP